MWRIIFLPRHSKVVVLFSVEHTLRFLQLLSVFGGGGGLRQNDHDSTVAPHLLWIWYGGTPKLGTRCNSILFIGEALVLV